MTEATVSVAGDPNREKRLRDRLKLCSEQDDASAKKKRAAKPTPQMKPGQVVIGRRLYRSGQSEYLINGRTARLRDVQELFMGVGLGPDSYAIIEQGRIGMIFRASPPTGAPSSKKPRESQNTKRRSGWRKRSWNRRS